MNRLTKKVGDNYCSQSGDFYDLYNKLGKLEDLEEQLGCPLEVVFKALENGIYIKNSIYNGVPEYIRTVGLVYMNDMYGFALTCFNEKAEQMGIYLASEYKLTWWLKEDKSE